MTTNLLDGDGGTETPSNHFNVLETAKKGVGTNISCPRRFFVPLLNAYVRPGIALDLCRTPSNTPHPTSLREATFSHKGRR